VFVWRVQLLQQEIIDETDQYVDNLQVTRVDAYNLTTSLPPRLRKVGSPSDSQCDHSVIVNEITQ
jgi:hypothetical protein